MTTHAPGGSRSGKKDNGIAAELNVGLQGGTLLVG
jgi:hypothetical protein